MYVWFMYKINSHVINNNYVVVTHAVSNNMAETKILYWTCVQQKFTHSVSQKKHHKCHHQMFTSNNKRHTVLLFAH